MDEEKAKSQNGRASQVGAASIGTILIYIAKLDSTDPVYGQITIYATPFLTILSAGLLTWLETSFHDFRVRRRAKNELDEYLKYCKARLENEALDEEERSEIKSKLNHVNMAAFHDKTNQVLKNFPEGVKLESAKKSNRKNNSRSTVSGL